MQLFGGQTPARSSVRGETFFIVVLSLVLVALVVLAFIHELRPKSEDGALIRKIESLEQNATGTQGNFDSLTQEVKGLKEALDAQKDDVSRQSKELVEIKKSLDETSGKIASVDAAVKQHKEAVQTSLSGVNTKLDGFTEQIKKLKEGVPVAAVPVVEVKVDPGQPSGAGK